MSTCWNEEEEVDMARDIVKVDWNTDPNFNCYFTFAPALKSIPEPTKPSKDTMRQHLTHHRPFQPITIKKVIFSNPATIVFWSDGEKTVVKCSEREDFDPEKGLAMAIAKRALGNKGNYYNTFVKYIPELRDKDDEQ